MAANRFATKFWSVRLGLTFAVLGVAAVATVDSAWGAISWDSQSTTTGGEAAGSGTQWWFDPFNWSAATPGNPPPYFLPPTTNGTSATDSQISTGTDTLPGGEGVVYDPANDPNFANAGTLTYPSGFGPQVINQLYISRATPTTNQLTIKGDLTVQANMIVGRSSGTRGVGTQGIVVQTGGKVTVNNNVLDLGQTDTGTNPPANGFGNGTYDYRGGILEVSQVGGAGLRLSVGTNSNAQDGQPAGAGGVGKFIMHNPSSGGYVRPYDMIFGGYAGPNDGMVTPADPNGITTGVAIAEFHYENGGVRPFQISRNLSLNNGQDPNTFGTRSARLDLQLNSAVAFKSGTVPIDLGLFDVDFDQTDSFVGSVTGTGAISKIFSNVTNTANYTEGSTVSAVFGNTTYNWTISYTGNIAWGDADNSVVSGITGAGTGLDVVLIGLSSVTVATEDADFNNDGTTDGADLLIWQRNAVTASGKTNATGDANGDGAANSADLGIWKTKFGSPATPAIGAAPEPASMALAAIMGLAILGSRRRK